MSAKSTKSFCQKLVWQNIPVAHVQNIKMKILTLSYGYHSYNVINDIRFINRRKSPLEYIQ